MTDCILRVRGPSVDVDSFLAGTTLQADQVWHKGEKTRRRFADTSGFSVLVSSSKDDSLAEQMEGAIQFLTANRETLRRLSEDPTLEAGLDFARHRHDPLPIAEYDRFSRSMVSAAADCGLFLELSHYMVQEDDDDAGA